MITVQVDTKAFEQMVSALSVICSAPPDEVLREEVGKVLSQALKDTKAATKESIVAHAATKTHTLQPASLYQPKRPKARKLRGGKVLYNLSYRYPNALWSSIQRARAADLKRRIAARGLAKQSWYKLGLLLGLAVEAPDYVKKAVPTTGKTYQDENVKTEKSDALNSITVETSQPTLVAIGGQEIIERAAFGRIQYFETNVAKDVFDKLTTTAKRYPGITVSE